MTGDDIRSRDRCEERLTFETLISDISARLVTLPLTEVDQGIVQAFDAVREFFDCDRCGLLSLSEEGNQAFVTHASYAENVPHVSGSSDRVVLFPWARMELLRGNVIKFSRLSDLPPEAEKDRQSWAALDVASTLEIPIHVAGCFRYVIVIQCLRAERVWPEAWIPRVRLLGEVFANTLERKKSEQALRLSEERLRLATDAAGVGLWAMEVDTRSIWLSERARVMFDLDPDEEPHYQRFREAIHPDDRLMVDEQIEQSLRLSADLKIDFRVVLSDGSLHWIHTRGRLEHAAPGKASRLMGISIDITERKRTQEVLRGIGGRLIHAAENERAHLARELHDDFNQRMSLVAVELDILNQSLPQSEKDLHQKLGELSSVVKDLSADMQRLSRQIHPAKLAQLGLVAALQSLCREVSANTDTQVEFFAGVVPRPLPDCIALCLYRIAQEALQNVIRHSEARDARVMLSTVQNVLSLSVSDSGRGFVLEEGTETSGLGLISMRERVRHVNGELILTSAPGKGTRVEAHVPV
ncbi:MAG: PAS domain-containing protein [Candidatus Hydrogenedentes bacterium]|nr:PAS domain-containing protein [Candidatus Hydrogenedentota bacterium]